MKEYKPVEGSYTEKLLIALLKLGVANSSQLADASGVNSNSIQALMASPIDRGLVIERRTPVPGKRDLLEYHPSAKMRKLFNADPVQPAPQPDVQPPKPVESVSDPESPVQQEAQNTDGKEVLIPSLKDVTGIEFSEAPVAPATAHPFPPVRFAVWDDGGISVSRGVIELKLTKDATHRLRALINAVEALA